MLWLRKLIGFFVGKPQPSNEVYYPKERLIYSYWDGKEIVKKDPLVLYKRLMEVGPELNIHLKVANSPLRGNVEASNKVMEKICSIFDILPLSKGGLTETEATGLLNHFLVFCETVKKNSNPSSTDATPSPTSSSSSAESPTTNNTSVSNSTATVSPTDVPMPQPSVSESCSVSSNPNSTTSEPIPMEREKPCS